jgi:hypothetical protein
MTPYEVWLALDKPEEIYSVWSDRQQDQFYALHHNGRVPTAGGGFTADEARRLWFFSTQRRAEYDQWLRETYAEVTR